MRAVSSIIQVASKLRIALFALSYSAQCTHLPDATQVPDPEACSDASGFLVRGLRGLEGEVSLHSLPACSRKLTLRREEHWHTVSA